MSSNRDEIAISVYKKKKKNTKRSLMMPWKMLKGNEGALRAEKGRQQGSRRCLVLGGTVWGMGAFISCVLGLSRQTGEWQQRHGVLFCVFFHHFFSSVFPLNQSLRVHHVDNVSISFSSGPFSRLVIISQAPWVWVLSSFSEMIIFRPCYVKLWHSTSSQALSNGPPWKFLLTQDRAPSGLMFVLSYYHKMREGA